MTALPLTGRRTLLKGLAAAMLLPARGWGAVGAPLWVAAARSPDGTHALHGIAPDGSLTFAVPLPGRGHAAAVHPERAEAVAFARRPGTFGVVLDCRTGAEIRTLAPPEGRQFNGHGAFSSDGATLYTSEVVAEGSAGRIGIWETRHYRRVGEWESGGIGPHDLRVRPDGTLVVANGGIQTDPQDRTPLNLDTMRPNLAALDAAGVIVAQQELDAGLAQNSIRHLALVDEGVAFAMQWQGDAAEAVPLLGLARGGALTTCAPPEAEAYAMQGYAGSIAAGPEGIILTSPRGGVAMIHGPDGTHRATLRRPDVCGAAVDEDGGFVVTDGSGAVWAADSAGLRLIRRHELAWDNHLVRIG